MLENFGTGRDATHIRDLLLGNPCGHRKYGHVYDTYSTIHSYWPLTVPLWLGRLLKLLGFQVLLCIGPLYPPVAWRADLWGPWTPRAMWSLSLWGILKECDLCKTRLVRWPGWEPPIRKDVAPHAGD